MKPNFLFYIDVVGFCNLQCPSCPVGNFKEVQNPKGFMEPELLNQIMKKATAECNVTTVGLYNWTESLLHPQLPDLIKIVQSYHIPCYISSNLNILKNPDAILAANPSIFRISASGFTQEVYGITHRGGDIERVKQNMILLAESKKRIGSKTNIHVYYHRYLNNQDDEVKMKHFCDSLQFDFTTGWAVMMPLEKTLAYASNEPRDIVLTQEDRDLIDRLALPLTEALKVAQQYKNRPCALRDNQMTMDFQGNVQLCCGVYDASKYTLANFLDTPLSELQHLKYAHNFCKKCMELGEHIYIQYGVPDEFDKIAKKNQKNP